MPQIRTNRAELLRTLQQVDPGLSAKDFIAQSTAYVFSDGWVATFNDEVCCRARTGLPPDLTAAVTAAPLRAVLEKLADEEVDLELVDTTLHVRAHRTHVKLRTQSEILLPIDQVDSPEGWTKLPEDFPRALEAVLPCAGTNQQEFVAVCVHMHPEWLEACDRRQATRYEIETGLTRPFLVRAKSLAHVVRMGATKVGETDNWVHFRNATAVISVRRHLEEYPNIARMLDFEGVPAVLPRGAIQAAELGGVFTAEDRENDKVLVTLSGGYMRVTGEGVTGEATVTLDTTYRGDEIRFRIAPSLLSQIVRTHNACVIADGRMKVEGDRWRYVVLLNVAEERAVPTPAPVAEVERESETAV